MAIITEAKLTTVLQSYNPWWRSAELIKPLSRPHKRVVYHEAFKVATHRSLRRFAVLSGARRVGKTTVLYQMIEKLIEDGINVKNILYVTFDNPIIKMVNVDDVLGVYDRLYTVDGQKYLFFDEIQYTADWELWMKVIYDSRAEVRLVATGSASPIIEKGATDSGTGRWNILKVPTLSFYEYCELLELADRPVLPDDLTVSGVTRMRRNDASDIMNRFVPLQRHFNRYLTIGGFPELVLTNDDAYGQRMLREDVVDKVIKRDVLLLFNVRNPLSMEKLFLYLCMTSSEIFNKRTASKELDNIGVQTIEDYVEFLERSNLIYVSYPMMVGTKAALKGKPKIYIADAAIRCAVLMIDDVLSDDVEMGVMVETTVYKHIISFYQLAGFAHIGYYRKAKENQKEVDIVIELPKDKILCEVKYRNNSALAASDAIIALSRESNAKIKYSFVITKDLTDFGVAKHDTLVPVYRFPALPFVYLLGRSEALGESGRL
ncbi:MAG: ATP-binding protein [Oscillospiraceae bacterium]|jgi:predicted AAA+ superfamily ATPase|nr:ATP-binding protein [Oscillospiraceae bacterium]